MVYVKINAHIAKDKTKLLKKKVQIKYFWLQGKNKEKKIKHKVWNNVKNQETLYQEDNQQCITLKLMINITNKIDKNI